MTLEGLVGSDAAGVRVSTVLKTWALLHWPLNEHVENNPMRSGSPVLFKDRNGKHLQLLSVHCLELARETRL